MAKHDIFRTVLYGAIAIALIFVIAYFYEPPAAPSRAVPEAVPRPVFDEFSPADSTNPVAVQPVTSPVSPEFELKVQDLAVGTGAEVKQGQRAVVHYVGTLLDGTKFDSSRDRGTPFAFTLGVGDVIKGWDFGVIGMKVGGVRKLTIPPDLGYGDRGVGPIPANSTLVFEIELLGVE